MDINDPNGLCCPSCGARNDRGICGISLMNPVGCDEFYVVVKCAECDHFYIEVEEDGEAHRDGPDYWTKGPYGDIVAAGLIERIKACPERTCRLCDCTSHKFMEDFAYGDFRRAIQEASDDPQPEVALDIPSVVDTGVKDRRPFVLSSIPLEVEAEILADVMSIGQDAQITVFRKSNAWAREKLGVGGK